MSYYMFPYYGSECLSNNKSHSSNKFYKNKSKKNKTKKKLIRVQVMPNGNTFFETVDAHPGFCVLPSTLVDPPATSCARVENQCVRLVCPQSPLSPPPPLLPFLFGHHGWTDKCVVVTAETVNTNADDMRPLEFILKGAGGRGEFQGA